MLFFSNLIANFCVCQNLLTKILVVRLELGMHQHNQVYLVNIMFASILQDLDIIEGAPLFGSKTKFKWCRPHHTIDFVKGGVVGAAFVVCIVWNAGQHLSISSMMYCWWQA